MTLKARTKIFLLGIAAYIFAMQNDAVAHYAGLITAQFPHATPIVKGAVLILGLLHNPLVQECLPELGKLKAPEKES